VGRVNVAVRELWRGRVWRAFPVRLVERRPDGAALLWSPAGTPVVRPFAGEVQLRIPGDVEWELRVVHSSHQEAGIVVPGRRYSLWHFFDGPTFREWYVNLERESRWNGACFDFVDEKLDLVVSPDGAVRWKDEDELAEAAAQGYLDEGEVRAEAERLLAAPPWPTGLETFAPDPAWATPELPAGWEVAPLVGERLRLAPLTVVDEEAYAAVVGRPAALAVVASSDRHWREDGFGCWAILDEGGFAGAVELRPTTTEGELEIGWALAPDRRGRGLAAEAVRAAVTDARTRTGAHSFVAYVEPGNDSSLRLAGRLGFRRRGSGVHLGEPAEILELGP
jgi:ribosomal protein S18 acetylase RimI-like enzyme